MKINELPHCENLIYCGLVLHYRMGIFSIEENSKKKLTFLDPIMNKASSLSSLASIGTKNKLKRKVSRRYAKNKSVIVMLVVISILFMISTIPMGIARILIQFLHGSYFENQQFLVSFLPNQIEIKKICRQTVCLTIDNSSAQHQPRNMNAAPSQNMTN